MSLVNLSKENAVAVIELDRKDKRNALSSALRDEIESALCDTASDDNIKVVIVTGGEQMFSAGYDLAEMLDSNLTALFHRGHEYTSATLFFEKPLITAVAGFAIAGGFDLMMSGDRIIASEGTKLGRPEIAWGVNPLMTKLSMRIGPQRALAFSLRGELVEAREALQMGLVDRVVSPSDLLSVAKREAETMAKHPLPVLMATKRSAYKVGTMSPRDAIEYEFGVTGELIAEGTPRLSLEAYARRVGVIE